MLDECGEWRANGRKRSVFVYGAQLMQHVRQADFVILSMRDFEDQAAPAVRAFNVVERYEWRTKRLHALHIDGTEGLHIASKIAFDKMRGALDIHA